MRNFVYLIWILLWGYLLCFYKNASATFNYKKIYVQNVHLKHGLSQCVVTNMLQDYRGFIWAATFDGLNRFDGSNMITYRHNPNDTLSLPSSKILKIYADYHDHLYALTADGFCVFDYKKEKLIKPEIFSKYKDGWVCNKDENHLWYYAPNTGIIIIDTRNFKYELLPNTFLPNNKGAQTVMQLIYKNNQLYIILHNGNLGIYNETSKQLQFYKNNLLKTSSVTSVALDAYNKIYISSFLEDIICFDINNLQFEQTDLYNKNQKLIAINTVLYDSTRDVLYLSSYGQGLFVYNYQTKELEQYKKMDKRLPLASNYLLGIISNRFGVIYINYDGMGFDILDPFIKKFSPITHEDNYNENNLKYVRKIVEDPEGNLLIGTSESGLAKYEVNTGKISFYNYKTSLSENKAFIIEMYKMKNQLYMGYNGSGIGVIDIRTLKLNKNISVGNSEMQVSDGTIWSFASNSDSILWIGTRNNGINKLNTITGKIVQYTKDKYSDFSDNGIRYIDMLPNGHIFLGTEKGVFIFDITQEKLIKVFPLEEKYKSYKSVKSMHRDFKSRYWVCTDGAGIVILDSLYKPLHTFNTNNGLNNNVIYGLLPESDSSFWISTNAGLSNIIWNENVITKKSDIVSNNYNELNGLQSNEFNTGAFLKTSRGYLVFGGLNGLNYFHPDEIKKIPTESKVYFNEIKIYENNIESEVNVSFINSLNLNYYENAISIGFSYLGVSVPENVKYKYQMEGYDKHWIEAGKRNYVSYTNLAPGQYTFKVLCTDPDGNWIEKPTILNISIATAFYNTWWFYTLIAIILFTIIYGFFLYRTNQIQEKELIKRKFTKELAEVEMKALRAQINPHFLFNSLNSINNFILKNDTKQASKYLVKFSQLVRNILNNSSNTYISLEEELHTIELYMIIEGMRFSNQFSYKIEVEEGLNTSLLNIPSLLLQPYVENAIWHGLLHKDGEKYIIISVKKIQENSISITIEDNGVGRKVAERIEQKPKHRKSFGMQLGESRIRILNQENNSTAKVDVIDLYSDKNEALGTKIDIIIPAKNLRNEHTILN